MQYETSSLKEIKLNDSIETKVSLSENGDLYKQGTKYDLRFSNAIPPVLNLHNSSKIPDEKYIKCENDNSIFWLINSSGALGRIYPELICLEYLPKSIHSIEFYISVFSPAFQGDQKRKKYFSYEYDNTTYGFEIVEFIGDNGCNETKVIINKIDDVFGFSEIMKISNDLRIFFHLLFAFPVLIENIWLVDSDNNRVSTYIRLYKHYIDSEKYHPLDGICNTHNIEWKSFELAYKKYFSNKNFEQIWKSIPNLHQGLPSYEYEILAFMTFLDKYVSTAVKNYGDGGVYKIPPALNKDLKEKLCDLIDNFQNENSVNFHEKFPDKNEGIVKKVLLDWKDKIKGFSSSPNKSFKLKISIVFDHVDERVKNLMVLENHENVLSHINDFIKIRDSVAHGDIIKIEQDPVIIRNNISFLDKIKILLWYFIYKDFGFSDDDYIKLIGESNHPMTTTNIYI